MAGIIEVKDQGKVRIYDADNSNYVDIVVPSTVSSNRTITIPDASFTIPTTNTVYTHPNHSGEVTSTADGATVIADNIVDEANLKVSNSPTNGYMLTAQSGNTGGLTWAEAGGGKVLQIKYAFDTGTHTTTSTSYSTLETVAITPIKSSSVIKLIFSGRSYTAVTSREHYQRFYRDSTLLEQYAGQYTTNGQTAQREIFEYFDASHNTTSEITYSFQHRSGYSGAAMSFSPNGGSDGGIYLTAMEFDT